MIDLVAAMETAAQDPLVIALGLVLGVVMVRASIGTASTEWADVAELWRLMRRVAEHPNVSGTQT